MQKDLLKLALTGLAAGICLSAQGGGSEIAMGKCSRTPPPPNEEPKGAGQMMNTGDPGDEEPKEMDEEMHDESSCAGGCGNQKDQSSENGPIRYPNYMETKRLSAAKSAMGGERVPSMDK